MTDAQYLCLREMWLDRERRRLIVGAEKNPYVKRAAWRMRRTVWALVKLGYVAPCRLGRYHLTDKADEVAGQNSSWRLTLEEVE